jgi:hypothetical protein
MIKWYRRRRFIKAYKILRSEAERHLSRYHFTEFDAVNESHIVLLCHDCPDFK